MAKVLFSVSSPDLGIHLGSITEQDNGKLLLALKSSNGPDAGSVWDRTDWLLHYCNWHKDISPHSKSLDPDYYASLDRFVHEYFTEEEWALVTLEGL